MCVCGRDWKWKREKATCHHRGGIHRAIMVIPVAIWALQKATDRLSAMTRARLRGEVERGGQTAISLSSSVSLSQRILKASLSQVVASSILCLCCRHAMWREWIEKKKQLHHPVPRSILLHPLSLSINVYSPGIHQGPLSKCYHKEPRCSLHMQLMHHPHLFLLPLSPSCCSFFQVPHSELWLLLFTLVP